MGFEDKDLAQLNATIMVGLLFILGLTNLLPVTTQLLGINVLALSAAFVLPPFIISIIVSLAGHVTIAKWITAVGLGWTYAWAVIILLLYF